MTVHRNTLLSGLIIALLAISVSCSRDKSDSPASEPDQAVTRVARGLADGRPEMAWRSLPPSYREDVSELVHLTASKMDSDVWNQSFGVMQKITRLARDKREFILDQPMLAQSNTDRKELERGWDALVGIFDLVANSDLADLKQLEQLDIDAFLAETGGELLKHMEQAASLSPDASFSSQMSNLKQTKATVVSSSADIAVVRVEAPGSPAREEPYIQVEGHWVPKKLADGWDGEIAKARQQIEQISTNYMAENKASVLMQLSMIEGAVDSLLAADSAQEFNAALGPIMGMAMGAAMAQMSGTPSGAVNSASTNQGDAAMEQAMQEAMEQAMHEAMGAGVKIQLDGSSGGLRHGAPATRDERNVSVAAATAPEIHEPGHVRVEDAHRYVGQVLQVTTANGMDASYRLKGVRSGVLVFERNMYGGSMSFELAHDEVESLRTRDR